MIRRTALLMLFVVLGCASPLLATIQTSTSVALVPDASGRYGGAGVLPTSFPGISFTDVSVEGISATALSPFDTVVLYQVGDAGTVWSGQQKADINDWIYSGGKLIIYDSDACPSVDYTWLVYPFTTNNPGQLGSNAGTLTIVEENELSSNDPASPYYIDAAWLSVNTDAIGDANVMISRDTRWFADMQATNANGVTGWCHTYAEYGHGLILYNGIDTDYIGWGDDGWLTKIWQLELAKSWDPADLPGTTPVGHAYWKGYLSGPEELRYWTLMATVTGVGSHLSPESMTSSGDVAPMSWWETPLDFILKLWSRVSSGLDAILADLGQLTLQIIDVVEFGQEAGSTLDALTGKPGADPEKSQALQDIEQAMDSIPQSEIQFYLDGYASAPSYDDWYQLSPPNRFFELWDHSDEFRAARYVWVMQHVAAELGKLGLDVAY